MKSCMLAIFAPLWGSIEIFMGFIAISPLTTAAGAGVTEFEKFNDVLASAPPDCIHIQSPILLIKEYAGLPVVQVAPNGNFNTDYQHLLNDVVNNDDSIVQIFADEGCVAGPDLTTAVSSLRYQLSSTCMTLVWQAVQTGSASCTPTADVATKPYFLCDAYAQDAFSAYQSVIQSPACSNINHTISDNRLQARSDVTNAAKQNSASNPGVCLMLIAAEKATCGFNSMADAMKNCPSQTDDCCVKLVASLNPSTVMSSAMPGPTSRGSSASVTATQSTPKQSSSFNSTTSTDNGSGVPVAAVVGGVAGALLVITLAVVAFLFYRRRSQQSSEKSSISAPIGGGYDRGYNKNIINNNYSNGNTDVNAAAGGELGRKRTINLNSSTPIVPAPVSQNQDNVAFRAPSVKQAAPATPVVAAAALAALAASIAPSYRDSVATTATTAEMMMRIIHPYNATLADELTLVPGGDIILLKAFDDGWGLGMNPATGAQGAFPLVCCIPHEEVNRMSIAGSVVSELPSRFSKRVSSAVFTAEQIAQINAANPAIARVQQHHGVGTSNSAAAEYLRSNGYDPNLDDGLPSATASAAGGIPSVVPSEAFGMFTTNEAMPSTEEQQQAMQQQKRVVAFSSAAPEMHVYRDSVSTNLSSVTGISSGSQR